MIHERLTLWLASVLFACSSLAFAEGAVSSQDEQKIVTALEAVGSGYTNVRVLGEEVVNDQSCYRIAFTDKGNDVELILNKETFRPCDENFVNEQHNPVPVWNPAVWAAVHGSIIGGLIASSYPYRSYRSHRSYRPYRYGHYHRSYRGGYCRRCR